MGNASSNGGFSIVIFFGGGTKKQVAGTSFSKIHSGCERLLMKSMPSNDTVRIYHRVEAGYHARSFDHQNFNGGIIFDKLIYSILDQGHTKEAAMTR